jgi:hypothetical protein
LPGNTDFPGPVGGGEKPVHLLDHKMGKEGTQEKTGKIKPLGVNGIGELFQESGICRYFRWKDPTKALE